MVANEENGVSGRGWAESRNGQRGVRSPELSGYTYIAFSFEALQTLFTIYREFRNQNTLCH